jgi:hypothetical protein
LHSSIQYGPPCMGQTHVIHSENSSSRGNLQGEDYLGGLYLYS